jgi:hypothetical protein
MFGRTCCTALIVLAAACGKPVGPSGQEDASFTKASMGIPQTNPADPNRPLAADLAVEPVSMLVMFNRLHTADKLQEALNKKPGQFSRVDIDKDTAPDPLTVVMKEGTDGHAVEIRARPPSGEYVVATMLFDPGWEYLGHYNGLKGGGASTVARPLLASGAPAPAPTITPAPVATTPTPVATTPTTAAPPAAPAAAPAPTGGVQAVPASSGQTPGVQATP